MSDFENQPESNQPPPPPHQAAQGQQPQQPGWGQAGSAPFNPNAGPGQPGHAPPMGYGAPDPMAPFGRHPATGEPYGDKSKVIAGVLQLVIGVFGVGRFYTGHTGMAIAQLFTCGGLGIWSLIDGIMLLVTDSRDAQGRLLKM